MQQQKRKRSLCCWCAGKPDGNLEAALSRLAHDPVANLDQLPLVQSALQASHHHRQQLKSLAQQMAHVLPRTVSTDGRGITHLKQAELQRLIDSNEQESQRGARSGEESRVGLGVLMIGLWSQKVKQNLAAQGVGDSRKAQAADFTSSSSAAAVNQPSSSPLCTASQSTAKLSHASADRGSPATSHEQAAAQAASQEAPPQAAGSWADHMSVTASDAEEEEEAACIPDDVSMVSSILG